MAPHPSPPVMKWLAVLGEKTSLTFLYFYINSQKWLALSARRCYVDRSWYDSKFFYLPFTKRYPQSNRQIWCLHCLFDHRFTGFFNNIMQTRNLTADSKLLNWSFDSMRICCLFHTRLRQIKPKTGIKNVHKVLYNWFNLSLNHKKNTRQFPFF